MKKGVDFGDAYTIEGKMALPYSYFAGRVGSRFITSLRDRHKIMGVRCDTCGKVFVPPRQTCEKCFADIRENWVELENTGEIVNYTVVRYRDGHLPKEPPYILAQILLDGADTPLTHIVEGVSPEQVAIGQQVQAVFAAETTSTILDIDHFAPV